MPLCNLPKIWKRSLTYGREAHFLFFENGHGNKEGIRKDQAGLSPIEKARIPYRVWSRAIRFDKTLGKIYVVSENTLKIWTLV